MRQKPDQIELKICRKMYEQPHMSERQVENMKKKMEEAKMENRRQRRKRSVVFRTTAAAAAVVAAFVILPNTSADIAYAMENIPLLGRLVEVVEVTKNKFYIGCQFHPEFKSRPDKAHPLFKAFIKASAERSK